jgi:hypothetical protein
MVAIETAAIRQMPLQCKTTGFSPKETSVMHQAAHGNKWTLLTG